MESEDLLALFDEAYSRLSNRLTGLADDEWAWSPINDPKVSIRWRLQHLTDMLTERRNAEWLGVDVPSSRVAPSVTTAEQAVVHLAEAAARCRAVIESAADLDEPIGPEAGPYAAASRRSFVLHVLDELIHHAAEAALLRDLYPGRPVR